MADAKSLIISGFTQQRTQAKQGAGPRVGGVVLRALRQAASRAAAYLDKLRGSL